MADVTIVAIGSGCFSRRGFVGSVMVWLKTPVEETDDDGKRRMIGGRFERHCYAASAPADLEFLTSEEFDQVAIRPRDEGDLSGRHIGALPPHDHPHVDLAMETAVLCPYCSTLFRFDARLAPTETNPADCHFEDAC